MIILSMFTKGLNFYLIKIERLFAWVLFLGMLAYFVSGFGMTKGIIDTHVAKVIHLDVLPWVILAAFVLHVSLAIRMALMRWRLWKWFFKIILVLFFLAFVTAFIYVDRFYHKPVQQTATTTTQSVTTQQNTEEEDEEGTAQTKSNTTNSSTSSTVKTFTLQELAKYNGQNGQPAYVAVSGVVYDVSKVFVNGSHYSHVAGQDLTNAFLNQHIMSQITKYPVVGKLQ